jgi:hypothetical protein
MDVLAAAYAEAGKFNEAVHTARKAVELYERAADPQSAEPVKQRLMLYQGRHTYRVPP